MMFRKNIFINYKSHSHFLYTNIISYLNGMRNAIVMLNERKLPTKLIDVNSQIYK